MITSFFIGAANAAIDLGTLPVTGLGALTRITGGAVKDVADLVAIAGNWVGDKLIAAGTATECAAASVRAAGHIAMDEAELRQEWIAVNARMARKFAAIAK